MHNNTRTFTAYNIDCKTGKRWSFNVLTLTESIEQMIEAARHFHPNGVTKWRVAGRFIAQPGRTTVDFVPVSKLERSVIESALLAASKEGK
jgi:hypothetical protein